MVSRTFTAHQNSLQEQSEARWLKLIDQVRQETKEKRKKLENVRLSFGEKFKKIQMKLTDAQREKHEKAIQLNAMQEHMNQLKQEVKFLETEYIKSRAIIIKFEEKKKSQTLKKPRKIAKVED